MTESASRRIDGATAPIKAEIIRHPFITDYEHLFWDMAYRLEQWPLESTGAG